MHSGIMHTELPVSFEANLFPFYIITLEIHWCEGNRFVYYVYATAWTDWDR